ncbi:MAG TPA: VOC family protein [Patescibacteria group bacterium]|nr:VOC family protein [Patescibacteria group bacterium]
MMNTKLDHIGIYVKDLENTVKFYDEVFGFKERSRLNLGTTKIAFLDLGSGLLEVVQRAEAPVAPPGSWSHLAFTVEDFDSLVERVKRMGLSLREMSLEDESRIVFFKDPEGHDLEVDESPFNQ